MKKPLMFLSMFMLHLAVFSQVSGNYVTNNYNDRTPVPQLTTNRIYLSDTSFIIQANVMANVIADRYVATFGVSETAKTLSEANTRIDKRIQDFITSLQKDGVRRQDIYVDLTTQTQVADYKITGSLAEQYISGFEQKKNVIVSFSDMDDLEKMMLTAASYGIYDLARVDYVVTNINRVYEQLFQSAMEIINKRKEMYVEATNQKLRRGSMIYGERFHSSTPAELYRSYTPSVSTEYSDYSNYSKKKNLRESTTYYYEHMSYSGFDQVINPVVTEPAVQYTLSLQVRFVLQ